MTSNFFRLVEPGHPDTRIKFLYEYTLVPRWLLCPLMWKLSLFYHNWNFAPPAGEQSVGSEISFFGCPPPPDCTDGNHQHWQGPLPPPDTPETSPPPSHSLLATPKYTTYATTRYSSLQHHLHELSPQGPKTKQFHQRHYCQSSLSDDHSHQQHCIQE